jgi:hypothetical protein
MDFTELLILFMMFALVMWVIVVIASLLTGEFLSLSDSASVLVYFELFAVLSAVLLHIVRLSYLYITG